MRLLFPSLAALLAPAALLAQPTRFEVSFPAAAHAGPITGRLVVVVAKAAEPEPRMLVSPSGPAVFGVDVDALRPGQTAVVDARAASYPTALDSLPPGEYYVQPVLNVYERATRADGKTIWVHLNDGTQEFFTIAPGNLYGDVQKVRVGNGTVRVTMTHVVPPAPKPTDTEWVKHARIQSDRLTRFWGRPIYVNATVLVPKGWAERPDARWPAIYTLGHSVPFGFTTDSSRNAGRINPVTGVETGFDLSKAWRGDDFPRVVAISLEQQTPYFPDSYSVNSANNGPYGDAIVEEIIPALERQFRLVEAPWGRHVEGASTGGWQSLALQLQHPDFFGGAWVLQPDPIDFRRWQLVDVYADTNAFVVQTGPFTTTERPFRRTTEGQVTWTNRQLSRFENVLGSRGRSGYQIEAWEAIYGPTDADGYPKPLWDKRTGSIDRTVAAYMQEHGFDLRDYAERNWSTLGPKLAGKLHFFAGDMDDFYLNLAVYRFDEFLKSTTNPRSDATFSYGRPTKGHGWHAWTWAEFVRQVAATMKP
jgi:hypothetical protein